MKHERDRCFCLFTAYFSSKTQTNHNKNNFYKEFYIKDFLINLIYHNAVAFTGFVNF